MNEPKTDFEYILNGTGSVLDYLGAKQDKNEPDGERAIRIFPIGRRNFHLERDDNILLLSNKQPNEKSQNAHPSDHPKVNRSRDKYTKMVERKLHLMLSLSLMYPLWRTLKLRFFRKYACIFIVRQFDFTPQNL